MFEYILKRLLFFIPTFFIISLLVFGLSKVAPGDPVELALKGGAQAGEQGLRANLIAQQQAYDEQAAKMGLDKPSFYLTFTSAAYPTDLYKIKNRYHRNMVSRLIDTYGNSDQVLTYYNNLKDFELKSSNISSNVDKQLRKQVVALFETIYKEYQDSSVVYVHNEMRTALQEDAEYKQYLNDWAAVESSYAAIKSEATPSQLYVPAVKLYGMDNQYHNWITNFFVGEFGQSYRGGIAVSELVSKAASWTIIMNFFSILIAYLISIPLGVRGAIWKRNEEGYFPFINWVTLSFVLFIIMDIFFFEGIDFVLSAGISTFFHSTYMVLFHSGGENRHSRSMRLVWFVVGLGLFSANAALLYFLWNAISGLPFMLSLLIFSAVVIAEIIMSVKVLGGERITKIMTDSGDFITYAAVLWFLVSLPWLLMSLGSFLIGNPTAAILIGLVLAFIAFQKYRANKKASAEEQYTSVTGDIPKVAFKVTASGILVKGHLVDNLATLILFILYSLPSFWIGTIFIVFITTPEYGMEWFPPGVDGTLSDDVVGWDRFIIRAHELLLPIFCITYGSFAFLSRQMRGAVLGVVRQDYIRTAQAKGLNQKKVIWKHAFRNSLFPLITIFSSVFPRALAGSIAIELIYNVPGMGKLLLTSIVARDWPVVYTIVMIAAILTMIGNLVADMLYAVANPRVSYK